MKRDKHHPGSEEDRNFAKDVEKATEPIMDRARQIKEEVNLATSDLKQNIEKNNEIIKEKADKLLEAGDKFKMEAVEILRPEIHDQGPVIRSPYSLRGKKLYLILGTIILMAILAVVGTLKQDGAYFY